MHGRGAVPDGLEALAFLLGTWRGRGDGHFPTMDSTTFQEEIRFWHVGAPILFYVQWAWEQADGEPLPHGDGDLATRG